MSEKKSSKPSTRKPSQKGPSRPRQPQVVIFTGPGCKWCTVAKKHFKKHEIRFRTIDVTKDKKAAQDCLKHGCRGIPVILIGTRWICGFDQKTIDKLLGIK